MNAANEIAVDAFLNRKISFPGIWETVQKVMESHDSIAHPSLDAIVEADLWARQEAGALVISY